MKLGDWVHCTRCIRKTGNHYEVIPAGNTTDSTETALYFEHGAEENAEEHAADQHFRWPACRKACKEKVKPQIGLAARKFGRRWGERSAAQISHHKVPA